MSKTKAKPAKCKTPGCKKPVQDKGYCKACLDHQNNNHKDKKKASTVKAAEKKHASKPKEAEKQEQGESEEEVEVAAPKVKLGRKSRLPEGGNQEIRASGEALKLTRLQLIRERHEAMKREIDQIREDLESEEEE